MRTKKTVWVRSRLTKSQSLGLAAFFTFIEN